jgi:putative ABC transport system ATP-binding protein
MNDPGTVVDYLISVRDIVKVYDMGAVKVRALRGVSFDIPRGSFTSIMGPSGSGKTTLMHIIGCLSRPTSGTYRLGGEEVSDFRDDALAELRNREIGFVFQTFNLLPRATAQANVELPLLYDGSSKRDRQRRAREALESVGLGHRVEHRPNELSGGERQRVAIARALANNPSLILADEPTGNLDSESGTEVMAIFGKLHEEGNTLVIVTHEQYIAEQAETILNFRDGQLVDGKR